MTTNTSKTRLHSFANLRQYFELIRWFAIDSLWRFRGRCVLILASGLLALAAQVGALSAIAGYAHLLEQDQDAHLWRWTFQPRNSINLLILCAAGTFIALLISAALLYVSSMQTIRLRRRYQEFCAARVHRLLRSGLLVLRQPGMKSEMAIVMRLVRGDSGMLGRVAQLLIAAVVPAITTLIAFATLFYLDFLPTVILLVITSASVLFFYRVNISAVHGTRQREKHAPQAGRAYRKLLGELRDTPFAPQQSLDDDESISSTVMDDIGREFLTARDQTIAAIERSRLISNVFFAVITLVILLSLGWRIIVYGGGWGTLIIYLVAVRHGLVNFRAVTSSVASMNRFYPQLRRYRDFLESAEVHTQVKPSDMRQFEVRVSDSSTSTLPGSQTALTLSPGSRVLLLCAYAPNRYTVGLLIDTLLNSDPHAVNAALHSLWFVSGSGGIDHAAQAQHSQCQWILIDQSRLTSLPAGGPDVGGLDQLRDRIVLIVSRDAAVIGDYAEDAVIIADDQSILGLGPPAWATSHRQTIQSLLGPLSRTADEHAIDEDIENAEDEMV